MSVHGCVASSTCEIFTISVGNMFTSFRISESLSQAEVNHIYIVLFLTYPNQEIVRLDVSV